MYPVAHIGTVVKDADRSSDFYRKVTGCDVAGGYQDDRVKIILLKAGDGVIELVQYLNAEGEKRGAGVVDHIAFQVDDIEKAVLNLKEMGVTLLFDAPKLALGGTKKIMFFLGPDGERLEIMQDVK